MSSIDLSEGIAVLKLVERYGGSLSLSGPRVGRRPKQIAKGLLVSGHLTGTLKCLDLTDKGRAILANDRAAHITGGDKCRRTGTN